MAFVYVDAHPLSLPRAQQAARNYAAAVSLREIRTRNRASTDTPETPLWLPTKPTQIVLFDPRIIHAGGPVDTMKVAAFFALGAANEHTQRHGEHFAPQSNHLDRQLKTYLKKVNLSTA